jgi:5-methyltetrahydrofolate--homocysteine methyltransferase
LKKEYAVVRDQHARKTPRSKAITLSQARDNKFTCDWANQSIITPRKLGVEAVSVSLSTLREYIDWTPFFLTWSLAGKYPRILEDEVVGKEATDLFNDAQAMLDNLCDKALLEAKGIYGLFPANSVGDDIQITDTQGNAVISHHLRQQTHKPKGANYCLSDYIAPQDSGRQDYIGAFAVTAGIGEDELSATFLADGDDYNSIMVKALADRLAEAFAEYLHQQVRITHWGYAEDERLDNESLIRELYQGIRPAPGYAACPEHTEKQLIWDLLDVEKQIGMKLTESYAMWPGAAVSGWYFAHPDARYFAVAQIQSDQVDDYAKRKSWDNETAQMWLAPNING